MTLQPSAAPAAETEAPSAALGPRIYGVIDVLRADRIAGWAIDRSDSAAALDVDILREGEVVRTVRADRHRADLERGGVGTGSYGYRAEIDPPIEPGFEFTVTAVARAPDGARAELSRVGPALRAPDPTTRLLERVYETVTRAPTPTPQPPAAPVEAVRLLGAVERIEVVQARLEAALALIDAPKPPPRERGLRLIVFLTLAIALASLGAGIYSLWSP